MKRWLSFVLVILLVFSTALCEGQNLEVRVIGMRLSSERNGNTSPYYDWLTVDLSITNWHVKPLTLDGMISGSLVYDEMYHFEAETVLDTDLITPLMDVQGTLVFEIPKRVSAALSDESCKLVISAEGRQQAHEIELNSPVMQASVLNRFEGKGYDTAEEAVIAYLDAWAAGNLHEMLSCFAIESYVDHVDRLSEYMRLNTWTSNTIAGIPISNEYSRDLNIAKRYSLLQNTLWYQFLSWMWPTEQYGEFGRPVLIKDDKEAIEFSEVMTNKEHVTAWLDIAFVSFLQPEYTFPSILKDVHQQNLQKIFQTTGAEEMRQMPTLISVSGEYYVFAPAAIKYDGKWYLMNGQGYIAQYLGTDPYLMIKPWSEIIGDEAAHIPSLIPGSVKEESTIINADSSPQRIAEIQQMLVSIHLMDSSEVDGAYGNPTRKAVIAFQQFVNEQRGAEILEITGECDVLTIQYLQYCYDNGWDVGSAVNPPEPEPTEPPCAEPDEAAVSEIIGFTVEVDDYKNDGHIIELTPGKHSVSWSACSGVESFHVCLYDGDGNLMNSKTVSGDGDLTVKAADLVPGEIYRLEIGALPEGGSEADVIWQTIRITCSADAVLNPTRESEKTGVGKPVISLGSTAYQQNGIPYTSDDSITFNWMAEGDVEYYNVTLIYEDGTDYSLSNTTDTSKTVSAEQLIPGLWKLRIGAMPANGSEDDMKWNDMIFGVPGHEQDTSDEPEYAPDEDEPSGDCDEIIEYIDKDSAPEQIQLVQMELYKHGLIDPDDIAVGVLDEITIEAVLQFQMLVHEFYGIELEPIDIESDEPIFIDMYTLDLLLYRDLDLFS